MGIVRRTVPRHYIPINPDNIASKDWIVLLEAGTIVGCPGEKLRVALATLERKSSRNTISSCASVISWLWKDMIHEFMPCISVLSYTNWTLIRNQLL
jgi:hypothetical protein